ncbi:3'(2'),5'-bisphosphate nucleotidase CysQ [Alteromonas sp. a30]|uniref:3'(2'),5'-bisphosphate nucleotidase CysQ n=1 Tax=Alteromonas sp. a30 TaxID=2730917 RepID=UPI00227F44EA|nr:3'(2'),5'-bisphosphate nucleotidase CysQ [Alteromonas sp. a30]MCY7295880.1 3'(2'),5'-bisphosphate nucleotidase CysQ [Alteromonas sp. a30]
MSIQELTQQVVNIALSAGDAIMDIYEQDFSVYEKQDASPLTDADLAAHNIIVNALASYSDYPILSEESADIPWEERQKWSTYWLVDPLDGTKEFIKKNGEFTVNIALIDKGVPVLGVVYAPVLHKCYFCDSDGAFKIETNTCKPIAAKPWQEGEVCKVVGSRSHQSPEIQGFLETLPGETEMLSMGSSLKLCLVAEGKAHYYPRLGPTSEWDTGAAHAIVLAAGGRVNILEQSSEGYVDSGTPLQYNQKESVLNPYFLVSA